MPREKTTLDSNLILPSDMEIHDFPARYEADDRPVRRIALGPLMLQKRRKTFPRADHDIEPKSSRTGSIGFMDLVRFPFYHPHRPDCVALAALVIGIEPEHQGKGYFPFFLNYIETVARRERYHAVMMRDVNNERAYRILGRDAGYTLIAPAARHFIKWL